ncbi:MAG TPA: hypothetical protein VND98_09410 [Solirubrobacterales bacterium]|nr:hypothetical protein [Solirubrobacterales bacterium]
MRYMLLQNYGGVEDCEPMSAWAPEEVEAHIVYQRALTTSCGSAASFSTLIGEPSLVLPEI